MPSFFGLYSDYSNQVSEVKSPGSIRGGIVACASCPTANFFIRLPSDTTTILTFVPNRHTGIQARFMLCSCGLSGEGELFLSGYFPTSLKERVSRGEPNRTGCVVSTTGIFLAAPPFFSSGERSDADEKKGGAGQVQRLTLQVLKSINNYHRHSAFIYPHVLDRIPANTR